MFGVHIPQGDLDKAVDRVLDDSRVEEIVTRLAEKLVDRVTGLVLDRLSEGLRSLDQKGV